MEYDKDIVLEAEKKEKKPACEEK